MNRVMQSCLLLAGVMALTGIGEAQDASAVLTAVTKALGADKVGTLHYTGSGSSYVVTQDRPSGGAWPHRVMKSYTRDLNLKTSTSRTQVVRNNGTPTGEETLNHVADANSPWSLQYEFWITPYGFLKGAAANHATVEAKTVGGSLFKVVTFTLPGNHKVAGYINDMNTIERVETWIGDKGDTIVEAQYRDYKDFNGVQFPMMVTEKQAGELSLILIVKDVQVES